MPTRSRETAEMGEFLQSEVMPYVRVAEVSAASQTGQTGGSCGRIEHEVQMDFLDADGSECSGEAAAGRIEAFDSIMEKDV